MARNEKALMIDLYIVPLTEEIIPETAGDSSSSFQNIK
jgi:hypothetical protein